MLELIIRYFHFICFCIMGAVLFAEFLFVFGKISAQKIYRLSILDAIYGISALCVFILGLLLWFYFAKPASFYTMNIFFQIKIVLFIVLGLLSIFPTHFFIKNRKSKEIVDVPKYISTIIIIELGLFILIPLCAVFMASGYAVR